MHNLQNVQYQIKNWQTALAGEGHTIAGNIKIIDNFYIPQLQRTRRVWIYLPRNYYEVCDSYPVLYMHDGQSIFDSQTNKFQEECHVDEVLEQLCIEGKTNGAIVVAIDSDGKFRREEYNPVPVSPAWPICKTDLYAEFIITTLKPFIDMNFRTKPQRDFTGIAGYSAGAICSLYIGLKYQNIFSKIGAFSFTIMKSIAAMPKGIQEILPKRNQMKIYMDVGKKEADGVPTEIKQHFVSDFVQEIENFYDILILNGFNKAELMLTIDEQGEHNISAVARRFSQAFLWLYA
jgi:alpha-glucosidase